MSPSDDFIELIRQETGLPLTEDQAGLDLDQVPCWDSVYLLSLVVALEQSTDRRLSMPDVLAARSLRDSCALAAPA